MRGALLVLVLGFATLAPTLAPAAEAAVPTCSVTPGRTLPVQEVRCGTMPTDSGVPGGACAVMFNPQPDPPGEPFFRAGCFAIRGRVGIGCDVGFNPQPDPPGEWCAVRGV